MDCTFSLCSNICQTQNTKTGRDVNQSDPNNRNTNDPEQRRLSGGLVVRVESKGGRNCCRKNRRSPDRDKQKGRCRDCCVNQRVLCNTLRPREKTKKEVWYVHFLFLIQYFYFIEGVVVQLFVLIIFFGGGWLFCLGI